MNKTGNYGHIENVQSFAEMKDSKVTLSTGFIPLKRSDDLIEMQREMESVHFRGNISLCMDFDSVIKIVHSKIPRNASKKCSQ